MFATGGGASIGLAFVSGFASETILLLIRGDGDDWRPAGKVGVRQQSVRLQEDKARRQPSAFVSIHERVIAAQIEEVGGGHFNPVFQERFAAEGGLRRSYGRLEQRARAQPGSATMSSQYFGVNGKRPFDVKMDVLFFTQGA